MERLVYSSREDEDFCNNLVKVMSVDGRERLSHWWYLELVTPVEELEPYTISEGAGIIEVYNEKFEVVKAWCYRDVKAGVKALAEAEAECARLNEECRKEREND